MKKISKRKEFRVIILCLIFTIALVNFVWMFPNIKILSDTTQTVSKTNTNTPTITETKASIKESPVNNVSHKPIPILMYHYLRDYNDPNDQVGTNLSVSPTVFDGQMKWLKDSGYFTISPEEYISGKYPPKSVIVTFDDGYINAYTEGYKTLKKYGQKGIFYIITSYIGRFDSLSQEQIKEMSENGMIIGSHTLSHIDMAKATDQQTNDQLSESKSVLEGLIGKPVVDLCYPAGKYTQKTIEIEKNLGYTTAVTTKSPSQIGFDDYLQLPRLRIENITLAQFAKKIESVK